MPCFLVALVAAMLSLHVLRKICHGGCLRGEKDGQRTFERIRAFHNSEGELNAMIEAFGEGLDKNMGLQHLNGADAQKGLIEKYACDWWRTWQTCAWSSQHHQSGPVHLVCCCNLLIGHPLFS
jgi:hypothetical protein